MVTTKNFLQRIKVNNPHFVLNSLSTQFRKEATQLTKLRIAQFAFVLISLFSILILLQSAKALAVGQNVSVTIIPFGEGKTVAYIYVDNFKIDRNVVDVLRNLSYNVTFIHENNLPINFSRYSFIYVDNEVFHNANKIPIGGNTPSIVSNYHNTYEWGLTDRDGVSQLSSSSSLAVLANSHPTLVYTQAFSVRRIGVPYYFLDAKNKAPDLVQIAGTPLTSSGRRFGDVISYAYPGAQLLNGKTAQNRICYFGIIASNYWTSAARQMFEDCVNFVSGANPPFGI